MDDLLRCESTPPFVFVHYGEDPGNWFVGNVDGVNVWLPYLQEHPLTPGCAGVRTRKTHERRGEELDEARALIRRRGGTEIPLELGYRASTPCVNRYGIEGRVYHDAWSRARPLRGRNRRTVKFTVDHQARNRWLLSLIESGVIAPPAPELLDERIAMRAARIDRVTTQTQLHPEVREQRISEAQADAEIYESAAIPGHGTNVLAEAAAQPAPAKAPGASSRKKGTS